MHDTLRTCDELSATTFVVFGKYAQFQFQFQEDCSTLTLLLL